MEGWHPVEDLVRWGFAHDQARLLSVDAVVVSTGNALTGPEAGVRR